MKQKRKRRLTHRQPELKKNSSWVTTGPAKDMLQAPTHRWKFWSRVVIESEAWSIFMQFKRNAYLLLTMTRPLFWGELIDKYKDINANSKTVFTDYAMLKLVLYSPNMFLLFCQSKVGVVKKNLLTSENWDLAGTYYHIDAMRAGNQLNRSERFTLLISDTDHSVSIRHIFPIYLSFESKL